MGDPPWAMLLLKQFLPTDERRQECSKDRPMPVAQIAGIGWVARILLFVAPHGHKDLTFSFQETKTRGKPEIMVCRILIFISTANIIRIFCSMSYTIHHTIGSFGFYGLLGALPRPKPAPKPRPAAGRSELHQLNRGSTYCS